MGVPRVGERDGLTCMYFTACAHSCESFSCNIKSLESAAWGLCGSSTALFAQDMRALAWNMMAAHDAECPCSPLTINDRLY